MKITKVVSGKQEKWEITEPVVSYARSHIADIYLNPGDVVSVAAGGCVQTGGQGKTWKRYANPSGTNSDRLYHGTIKLPGMPDMVRLEDFIDKGGKYTVPAGWDGHLQVGYEDDGYTDNGYYSHDDGTEDQCKTEGPAWITVTVDHPWK